MKVERIVFLQGDEADEAIDIFRNKGKDGALQYLEQFHYPGEHETSDSLGHGTSDDVYYISDYVLNVNLSLNYIGLEYILERSNNNG